MFLADVLGWSGLFIEPDEAFYASLARKYASNPSVVTHRAAVSPDNVQEPFAQCGAPAEPDILSIDIDGADYWIWERITHYRPRLTIIEYNAALPAGRRLVQPRGQAGGWRGTDYFGASLDALVELGHRQGYRLVHTDLSAAIASFVRADLTGGIFPAAAEVACRTEPNYFLQGYHHPPDETTRRYVKVEERGAAAAEPTLPPITMPSIEQARELVARTDFIWHQRFEVAPDVFAPRTNDVGFLNSTAQMPESLNGESVLDIGTTNGGVAFELERRGAGRVVAVDILDADAFGFNAIKERLGSRVEHLQATVYELPEILGEQFDLVLFRGVIYHLRHPLLALDNVRWLTRQFAYVESAICDGELPQISDQSVARVSAHRAGRRSDQLVLAST